MSERITIRINREDYRLIRRLYEQEHQEEESFSAWARRRVAAIHPHTPPEPALLGVKQVIRILGCSRTTLFRMARDHRIVPPIRIGGRVVWPETALLEWLTQGAIE